MNFLMKSAGVKILLLALSLWLNPLQAQTQQDDDIARKPVPAYTGLANDFAGVLSSQELATLDQKLKRYEDSTSTQVVVVIEKSLNGRDQFDRSMDFARGWGVGQKDKNNGIVVYLSIEDRKLSIRTANATQGALTDGETGDIRRMMQPYLKQQQYYTALDIGTDAIFQALKGEFSAGSKKKSVPGWSMIIAIILFIVFIAIINNRGKYRGYRGTGPYWWGPGSWPGSGGGGWGGGGSSGGGWGGMGGGGGFDGGGSDGGW